MTTCYDFIDIKIKTEKIQARPVGWDRPIVDGYGNGADGKPVKPTEFHATCPYCGNLVHFTIDDLYRDTAGMINNVKCLICRAGAEALVQAKQTEKKEVVPQKMAFIDPIGDGLFELEVDLELLKKFDLTEL